MPLGIALLYDHRPVCVLNFEEPLYHKGLSLARTHDRTIARLF